MLSPHRLAAVSFLVMESLVWFALATVFAGASGGAGPSYITILLAMLGAYALTRGLLRFDLSVPALVIAGAGVTVLALTLLLNIQYNPEGSVLSFAWLSGFADSPDGYLATRWPQTWGVIAACVVWFRGVWAAQQTLSYAIVLATFSLGLLLFVVVLVAGGGTNAGARVAQAALPFFLSGLFTLALVHLEGDALSGAGGRRGPWLSVVAGTVAALGFASAALGLFPLGFFNRLLAPVGLLLLRVLDLIILLIAFPISWLATFIITRIIGRDVEWPRFDRTATQSAERLQEQGERGAVAAFFLAIIKFLFVLAVIAAVAYVLYRVFRRLRKPARSADELRESLEDAGGVGDDLNALLRGLLGRFQRARQMGEPDLPSGIRRMRRIYVEMLDDAETRGAVRPEPATPAEFAPVLTGVYADRGPQEISARFAEARYGLMEPPPDDLARLDAAAQALRRALR